MKFSDDKLVEFKMKMKYFIHKFRNENFTGNLMNHFSRPDAGHVV